VLPRTAVPLPALRTRLIMSRPLFVAYAFQSPTQDHALVKRSPTRFNFKSNPARPPTLRARAA
jgi:hypothetical protein